MKIHGLESGTGASQFRNTTNYFSQRRTRVKKISTEGDRLDGVGTGTPVAKRAPMKINPIIVVVILAIVCAITGCATREPVTTTTTTTERTESVGATTPHAATAPFIMH
jgi:hypothetical protein